MRSVFGKGPPARRSLQERRDEREFFFWSARQWLALVALAAATLHVVLAVAQGETPGEDVLRQLAEMWAAP